MAWEARYQIYIGQTENPEKRLGQHFQNKFSSDFTEIYEPTRVRFLKPCHSRNKAESEEERIGKSHYDSDTTFAYWA
jgi:predicted GIY-YIG superfamily endonuclease